MTLDPERFRDLEVVAIHMSDARDVGVVHMPLQRIPPRERLLTTSNHQSTPKVVRSSLDAFLVGHALFDARFIQMRPIHPNSTAFPFIRLRPAAVSYDVALKVWDALVLLDVVASNNGASEARSLFDDQGGIFGLEVARGYITPVRVRTPASARRSDALLGFGGGRAGRREGYAMVRPGLGGLALPLLLMGGRLSRTVIVVVVVGGRGVGSITIRFRATTGAGRDGRTGGR